MLILTTVSGKRSGKRYRWRDKMWPDIKWVIFLLTFLFPVLSRLTYLLSCLVSLRWTSHHLFFLSFSLSKVTLFLSFLFFLVTLFLAWCLHALWAPCCWAGFPLGVVSPGYSLVEGCGLLITVAPLVLEHGLRHVDSGVPAPGFWSTGSTVLVHGPGCSGACEIFPGQGIEPVSPALAGRSLSLKHQKTLLFPFLKFSMKHSFFWFFKLKFIPSIRILLSQKDALDFITNFYPSLPKPTPAFYSLAFTEYSRNSHQFCASQWCDHSPKARHPAMWSQLGLRKHHYKQS